MEEERILSYKVAKQLTDEDMAKISAAGVTSTATANGTYNSHTGYDASVDVTIDS
jgi:exoribonuclease II